MSSYINGVAYQSDIEFLQQQIDDIESGVTQIDYTNSNFVALASDIIDPKTGLFNGTQAQIIDKYISNTANINGSKLLDNSISNSKLTTMDGSRIIDSTITGSKLSNGTISNINIAGNADIEQSKIIGLPGINTDVNTLKNYFLDSRLKLSNLAKSNNNYQVLSQDGSANDPSYRQLDSNYISSLNLNKINMNNNNQNILYCDPLSFNNLTSFINSLPTSGNAIIYPFSLNTANGYTINNNDTWLAINCSVNGHYKGVISSNVVVGNSSIATLNIGNGVNVYGMYYTNLIFNNVTTNINIFLNGYFENINFKAVNLNIASASFVMFYNCTFNQAFTIGNVGASSSVFLFNCNFTAKSINLSGTNSGSVIFSNCSNLPIGFLTTQPTNFFLVGINSEYVNTTTSISDLRVNQMTVPTLRSNLAIGNNKITTTATTFNNNELVTKSYVDSNTNNILPLNNTFTGQNTFNALTTFNLPNTTPTSFRMKIGSVFKPSVLEVKQLNTYINSVTDNTFNNIGDGDLFLNYGTTNTACFIGGGGNNFLRILNDVGGLDKHIFAYRTNNFNDGYNSDLFILENATTRSNSRIYMNCGGHWLRDIPGDISLGNNLNTNNTRDINDTIRIGGSIGSTAIGNSTIFLGWDDSSSNSSTVVTGRNIVYGCARTDGHFFRNNNGIFTFARRVVTSGNYSELNAVNGTLNAISSLSYKDNIINKTFEYIINQSSPIKNYYERIINCPIYTYTFIDSTEKEIHQGPSFEYCYENFAPHTLSIQPTLSEPNKKPLEWYEENNKKKAIRKGALLDYIILALQEQDKFIIKPLQQKYNELENKHNNLINYLKSIEILPANYIDA